jgi:hypothetical protein
MDEFLHRLCARCRRCSSSLIVNTPFEQLQNWWFVIGTTLSTYVVFVLSLCVGVIASRGDLKPATSRPCSGPIPTSATWGRR